MKRDYKIYAIDFDGTITNFDHFPDIRSINHQFVNKLKELQANGDKLILWTSRNGKPLDYALHVCRDMLELEFDAVNANIPGVVDEFEGDESRKIYADYYIDDRMISVSDFMKNFP